MLPIQCMQPFYNLSDPEMEEALYDFGPMHRFAHLKLSMPESLIRPARPRIRKANVTRDAPSP